jgi:hypothetical protein
MANLIEARKKAIDFLLKSIEEPWVHESNDNDPQRFEAHAYLAHKGIIEKSEWGQRVKQIWDSWIEDRSGPPPLLPEGFKLRERGRCFWPAVDRYLIDTGDPYNADWEPGFDVENHIAMFRTKEIFAIPGYQEYFSIAKRELAKKLRSNRIVESTHEMRLLWQIIRSPYLRTVLLDSLRAVAQEILDEKVAIIERAPLVVDDSLSSITPVEIFFLLFTNLEDDYFHVAKFFLNKDINRQRKNGSFREDVVDTCLYLCSAHISGIDPNRIIRDRSIEWLICKQHKNGSWRFHDIEDVIKTKELKGEDIFRTVFVMEMLDIIMNDKPLPNWAESITPVMKSKGEGEIRISPLHISKEIAWGDVSIRFISDESIEIRAGVPFGIKNFAELGYQDKRSGKPDYKWEVLKLLAKSNGAISWKDKSASSRWKPHIKTLRKRLKSYFGIQDDPFYSYKKPGGYRAKFSISFRENDLN